MSAYTYKTRRRGVDPVSRLLTRAKFRAKQKGIEFSITAHDIAPLPEVCPYFPNLKLEYGVPGGNKRKAWHTGSLDRIENDKGYVPGNVEVISLRANHLKSDGSLMEFRRIVEHLESRTRT